MKIIFHKKKLRNIIQKENRLGFVPTMGALHLGHLALIKKCIKQCDKTIVSIFVNKPQFNRKKDFIKYPRILNRDINILKKLKINFLYLPTEKDIYPYGQNKNIKIDPFSKKLCGKSRPGHFKAVVDVVDKFIKIINPTKIYFGKKDFQQLKIIENFIKINYPNIKVIGCNTVREKNGIAFSSRNFLLSLEEKRIASQVYRHLIMIKRNLIKHKLSKKKVKQKIKSFGVRKIDYLDLLDINKLVKPFKKEKKYKIFIAYYLGSTRLIDNI